MKIQFDAVQLRMRVDNAEFARLRAGEVIRTALAWPGGPWCLDLRVDDVLRLAREGDTILLSLPRADIDALAARLPARDGLQAALALPSGPLDVCLDVDLHDGRRRAR